MKRRSSRSIGGCAATEPEGRVPGQQLQLPRSRIRDAPFPSRRRAGVPPSRRGPRRTGDRGVVERRDCQAGRNEREGRRLSRACSSTLASRRAASSSQWRRASCRTSFCRCVTKYPAPELGHWDGDKVPRIGWKLRSPEYSNNHASAMSRRLLCDFVDIGSKSVG
jgi:hypothetical protein